MYHGSNVLKNSIRYLSVTSLAQVHIDYHCFKEKSFIKKQKVFLNVLIKEIS